jgi:hypothetical protein
VKILAGADSGGGTSSPKQTTGGVLDWTGGTVIVGVVGAILIGVALAQGYKGVARRFLDTSKTGEMSRQGKRAFTAIGVFGHPRTDGSLRPHRLRPDQGRDRLRPAQRDRPRRSLNELAQQSYGPVLLGVVAAGLIAFALYSIADARYRKI